MVVQPTIGNVIAMHHAITIKPMMVSLAVELMQSRTVAVEGAAHLCWPAVWQIEGERRITSEWGAFVTLKPRLLWSLMGKRCCPLILRGRPPGAGHDTGSTICQKVPTLKGPQMIHCQQPFWSRFKDLRRWLFADAIQGDGDLKVSICHIESRFCKRGGAKKP